MPADAPSGSFDDAADGGRANVGDDAEGIGGSADFQDCFPPLTRDFVTGYVKAPIALPPLIRGRRMRDRKRGPAIAGASRTRVNARGTRK